MPLTFYPSPGQILLCDYKTGFVPPEMTKRRPVVVVSPRLRRRKDLVTVVPLSTTEPVPVEPHQCEIRLFHPLPPPFEATRMWAKCDMIATVALTRLDRFKAGRRHGSHARLYLTGELEAAQLLAVRKAVLFGLGFGTLTAYL